MSQTLLALKQQIRAMAIFRSTPIAGGSEYDTLSVSSASSPRSVRSTRRLSVRAPEFTPVLSTDTDTSSDSEAIEVVTDGFSMELLTTGESDSAPVKVEPAEVKPRLCTLGQRVI